VSFDQGRWLEAHERLIEQAAPFPLVQRGVDRPTSAAPVTAGLPDRGLSTSRTVVLTGYDPNEKRLEWIPRRGDGAPARVAAAR
jgi:hypothetical protein